MAWYRNLTWHGDRVAAVIIGVLASGCVLSPSWRFKHEVIPAAIGKSFPNHLAMSLGPPIHVEQTERNTVVYAYRYYPNNQASDDCTIFYEVSQATIIAAWSKGPDCVYRY